jgi:hypothetical protein
VWISRQFTHSPLTRQRNERPRCSAWTKRTRAAV